MEKSYSLDKKAGKPQKPLRYLLLDVHGVLTDGKERKRFIALMGKKHKMDCDKHNSLWVSHLSDLDTGKEKPGEYIKAVNRTFHTRFSAKEYYGTYLKQIKRNRPLIRKIDEVKYVFILSSENISVIVL